MIFKILQIAIPFIWFGLIGGISFMEAPLKFQAPNVTLALGLGIGRLIFFTLNKIEILLAVLMVISFFKVRPNSKYAIYYFAVIAFLLALETFWLLPVLDVRAVAVINGTDEPYSTAHFIYIAFDAIKFILLFVLGTTLIKKHLRFT